MYNSKLHYSIVWYIIEHMTTVKTRNDKNIYIHCYCRDQATLPRRCYPSWNWHPLHAALFPRDGLTLDTEFWHLMAQ